MPVKRKIRTRFDKAADIFNQNGGMLRTKHALDLGIHPSTLYGMLNAGTLVKVSRGVYRLADSEPFGYPDLVTVAARIPMGVICLISALSFHEITTQIPHVVHLALPRGAEQPRLDFPPIKTYRFSVETFNAGVEVYEIDGVDVRIYSAEKTLADCFKFRNRIGIDTVVEAIRFYRERKPIRVDDIMHYAAMCRVEKIIRPYLEATL